MAGRMLERDYYLADFTSRYYPHREQPTLKDHLLKAFQISTIVLLKPNEYKELAACISSQVKSTAMSLAASLIGIISYKHIPFLKNYPQWKIRVPVSLGMLMLPFIWTQRHFTGSQKLLARIQV